MQCCFVLSGVWRLGVAWATTSASPLEGARENLECLKRPARVPTRREEAHCSVRAHAHNTHTHTHKTHTLICKSGMTAILDEANENKLCAERTNTITSAVTNEQQTDPVLKDAERHCFEFRGYYEVVFGIYLCA